MINEEILKAPVVTLSVPKGESTDKFIENYFGALPTAPTDMPSDADVEETVIVKLG